MILDKNVKLVEEYGNKLIPKLQDAILEWLEELKDCSIIINSSEFDRVMLATTSGVLVHFVSKTLWPLLMLTEFSEHRDDFMTMFEKEIRNALKVLDKKNKGR